MAFKLKTYRAKRKSIEHDLQSIIIKYLMLNHWEVVRFNSGAQKTENGYIRFYMINGKLSAGLPDLMVIKNGIVAFLEIKKDAKTPLSKYQKEVSEILINQGINFFKVSSLEEVIEITKNLLNKRSAV